MLKPFEIFLFSKDIEAFLKKEVSGFEWKEWTDNLDISSARNCIINEENTEERFYLLPIPSQA